MKTITILLLVLVSATAGAQTISKSVINTIGGSYAASDVKLTSNVGEIVVGLSSNENGNQLSSGYVNALDLSVLSTEDHSIITTIVYPNPTSDLLFIQNKDGQEMEISLFNETGQQLQSKKSNSSEDKIDITNLASGIYIVNIRLTATNKTNSYKIIKK
ncbi:T9SS type A sorting domain-containing protein [Flavobacterium sp. 3HN19-14]|uniref:T9SS type A sorting domain-containing protein n=1 Tax=Flavobacterium sp. 3HN19-14 TaxID=3448133 RepID=UPI003EE0B1AD